LKRVKFTKILFRNNRPKTEEGINNIITRFLVSIRNVRFDFLPKIDNKYSRFIGVIIVRKSEWNISRYRRNTRRVTRTRNKLPMSNAEQITRVIVSIPKIFKHRPNERSKYTKYAGIIIILITRSYEGSEVPCRRRFENGLCLSVRLFSRHLLQR